MTGGPARTVLVALVLHACFTLGLPFLVLRVAQRKVPGLAPASPLGYLGGAVIVIGVILYVRSAYELSILSRTPAVPLGEPRSLRTAGCYGTVRNPLLLGVVLILIGEALWFASVALLAYALLYWSALHAFLVLFEEPGLLRTFGHEYREYRRQVPRWLPRLLPSSGREGV